ncbi:MAG: APC family permease [Thaumarchaeota archaeon]|nr:APC family permease [Nitrososphaerota archaeon]
MADTGQTEKTTFTREATGLVREIGAWPSFFATWFLVTGGVPIFILTYFSSYPGANFPLIFVLALFPTLALAVLYTIFSISMPRSGGDYVYVSRGLHPFLGFVNSFSLFAAFLISNGVYAVFAVYYVGYHLSTQGIVDNAPSLLSLGSTILNPTYLFVLAVIFLIIAFLVAVIRPRYAWSLIFWAGLITLVATVVMFVALATIQQGAFQAAYDKFIAANNATLSQGFSNITGYQNTITAGGWAPPSDMLAASLLAFPLAWYSYTWYTLPSTWAGEIKHARRSMPITIIGAVIWIALYFIVFLTLTINAFGQPFLTSWSTLSTSAPASIPGAVSLYIPFFVYLVYHNPILIFMIFIALWLPDILAFPPLIIASTRYLFAWSFDRVLPRKFAEVSDSTHTPIYASIVALVVSVLGAALQAFDPKSTPSVLVPIFTVGYLLPALTAVVFPYIRKDVYETAFIVKRKVLGVPLISWLGVVSLVALIFGTYSLYLGGFANFHVPDYAFYASAYGLGVVIFAVAYVVRRRQGIDLSLAFKEIPPE